jgi:hypothetical protein
MKQLFAFLICLSCVLPQLVQAQAGDAAPRSGGFPDAKGKTPTRNPTNIRYIDDLNSERWAGPDIGAWINSAYADLPSTGGTIVVAAGLRLNATTPVVIDTRGKPALIECSPGGATYLGWTPSTGTFFTFDTRANSNDHPIGQGIKGCYLQSANADSSVAVSMGYKNSAEGTNIEDTTIVGFNTGVSIPAGEKISFNNGLRNVNLISNKTAIAIGANDCESACNGIEATEIFGGKWIGNWYGIVIASETKGIPTGPTRSGADVYIYGVSCDGPMATCVYANAAQSMNATIQWYGAHFENPNLSVPFASYLVVPSGYVSVYGGLAADDKPSGAQSKPWFEISRGSLKLDGIEIYSAGEVTSVPIVKLSTDARLTVSVTNVTPPLFAGEGKIYATGLGSAFSAGLVNDTSEDASGHLQLTIPAVSLATATGGITKHVASASADSHTITDPSATGTTSLTDVIHCGATSGATQSCSRNKHALSMIVFGDVMLNSGSSQSITELPFSSAASYSCSGSDLTHIAGLVTFTAYEGSSVAIQETGGGLTDHLRYLCVGF